MLDVSLLFKIGATGILIIIIDKVLKSGGKEDIAVVANLAGVILLLIMVINLVNKLFDSVKTLFQF
ncbi:stage III sporulation protein AC [Clostridium sp. CM028]|uniref:stage III sporulation protein AC n=1 Tax=unclassified Clostridium TaxID=2614128 RepID=UPI001C0E67B6|nr:MULTISPECIES: stage III sporulation protein AC [unclassified Clostridium]MBU3091547.1 stage III sporulation protein AC [Clostridium sp. CF011]MBW9144189.1 stage III sporulation protein AC [Clostridium sp. CM027]MBW9147501.1 stage III sporulation protein AC [Clostridium sp. CM028]UVE41170.1 stage III sporulation protein AC [Clostridium sp. CM027]WAG70166.1 stage III sporulation protein AC [Clostridium sp. CF011]